MTRTVEPGSTVDILLIEDDEEDYLLTRDLVEAIGDRQYRLEWVSDFNVGFDKVRRGEHDVCLLDYALGGRNGLEFLRQAVAGGCTTPIIVLTGGGSGAIEREALAAGAADYLIKGDTNPELLWRAFRHAVERGRAQAAARDHDRLFRAVFTAAMDAMLIADDDARYVDGNPAALALFGVSRDELVTKHVWDFAPNVDVDAFREGWAKFITAEVQAGEWLLQRPDGEQRILEYRATANIMPGRHLSVLRDITERRRAESTRVRLAAIVESAEDAIIGKDLGGTIQEWNPGAERIYGCSAAEAVGTSILRFVPLERQAEWRAVQAKLLSGEHVRNLETVWRRADGLLIDVSLTISPVRDCSGDLVGTCSITRDITETKRLRTRLAIADRMASVGTLAAGVAHEINNPLAAAVSNLDFAAKMIQAIRDDDPRVPELQDLREVIKDANDATERVRQIVRDLKLFSRPDDERRGPVDVRRVIDSTLRMVWNEIRHRAKLQKDYGDVPTVDASESRLGQVFLNLLVNAAQAIDEGHAEDNEIRIVTGVVDGRVTVTISDTGCGIAPDVLPRLFEPFYTTKPLGVGTGLGLSICQGIITSIGGDITVQSEVGKGTIFRVSLPPGTAKEHEDTPRSMGEVAGPRLRILIIDDEQSLVRSAVRILSPLHDVVGSTDARNAMQLIEAGEHFDVILCDLMMPHVTGMDVYHRLRERDQRAAERIIFLTGGAFTPRARDFLAATPNPRLEKPFEPAALLTAIRDCFGSS